MPNKIAETPIEFPGPPPWHWNCRTILVPIVKSAEELTNGKIKGKIAPETRASMHGEVPANLTYEDWFRTLPPEEQAQILGPTKLALWRTGKLSFADMVNQNTGHALTIPELEALVRQRSLMVARAGGRAPELVMPIPDEMTPASLHAYRYLYDHAWVGADGQTIKLVEGTQALTRFDYAVDTMNGSHYSPGDVRVLLNRKSRLGADAERAFRHEYGHHIDYSAGGIDMDGSGIYIPRSYMGINTDAFYQWLSSADDVFKYRSPLLVASEVDSLSLVNTLERLMTPWTEMQQAIATGTTSHHMKELRDKAEAALAKRLGLTVKEVQLVYGRAGTHRIVGYEKTVMDAAYDSLPRLLFPPRNGTTNEDLLDLIGSLTSNSIARGRHDGLYLLDPTLRATEGFANYVTLRGSADDPRSAALLKMLKHTMPKTAAELEKLYEAIASEL